MSFDLKLFGNKLTRCRNQLQLEIDEVVIKTGIERNRLIELEGGRLEPTGDEVLIISDFYKQDYHFFISNEQKSASEQIDILYRKIDVEISKKDRWAIQEFIYLCECEEFILNAIEFDRRTFNFTPSGSFFKQHGYDAADKLRKFLGFNQNAVIPDLYFQIRKIGFHVFRRRLENSAISGLMINHPIAGQCILINYDEDVFRQNFTAAHEMGHAIFDYNELVNISYSRDNEMDLREIRANTFASEFLVPSAIIDKFKGTKVTESSIFNIALKLKVNPQVLLIALKKNNVISDFEYKSLLGVKIPKSEKEDPEFRDLSERIIASKKNILERGLSTFYVRNCHDAYLKGVISSSRLAEILLTPESELPNLLALFNLKLHFE